MADNKTKTTDVSVEKFLKAIPDKRKRDDAFVIMELLKKASGYEPKMWGPAIIGFGSYHYKYESGREGDAPLAGFSPRKEALTFYLSGAVGNETLLKKLGKYKTSKGCLYIKKLEDVDMPTLKKLIDQSWKHARELHT